MADVVQILLQVHLVEWCAELRSVGQVLPCAMPVRVEAAGLHRKLIVLAHSHFPPVIAGGESAQRPDAESGTHISQLHQREGNPE